MEHCTYNRIIMNIIRLREQERIKLVFIERTEWSTGYIGYDHTKSGGNGAPILPVQCFW